ncbi:hypothetical protein [Mariniluteicoccus flavus]
MHRLAAAACAAGLTMTLAACGGGAKPEPMTPPPPAVTAPASPEAPATETPSAPATPSPAPTGDAPANPNQTPPEKLDQALLTLEQMPGWKGAEVAGDDHVETLVDPEACTQLHHMTVGKVASDMGATVGFDKDDLAFTEFLDVVDKGADSVGEVEKLVAQCPRFTMDDSGEKTPVEVSRFDAPGLGDRSIGVKVTLTGEGAADYFMVFAGHKDVLMTTSLQGESPSAAQVNDLSRPAMDKVKKSI